MYRNDHCGLGVRIGNKPFVVQATAAVDEQRVLLGRYSHRYFVGASSLERGQRVVCRVYRCQHGANNDLYA